MLKDLKSHSLLEWCEFCGGTIKSCRFSAAEVCVPVHGLHVNHLSHFANSYFLCKCRSRNLLYFLYRRDNFVVFSDGGGEGRFWYATNLKTKTVVNCNTCSLFVTSTFFMITTFTANKLHLLCKWAFMWLGSTVVQSECYFATSHITGFESHIEGCVYGCNFVVCISATRICKLKKQEIKKKRIFLFLITPVVFSGWDLFR